MIDLDYPLDLHAQIERLTEQRDELLEACKAMLEPFGGTSKCLMCDREWDKPGEKTHCRNCPIPIAEAAIAQVEPPATREGGEG